MENFLRGLLGMTALIGICYLLSNNRKAIDWKLVGIGLFAQFMLAAGVLDLRFNNVSIFWTVLLGIITVYIILKIRIKEKSPVKWSILLALFLLCLSVVTQFLPTNSFVIAMQAISKTFVAMISLSHKGTDRKSVV